MKKFFALVLLVSLLFSGCSKNADEGVSSNNIGSSDMSYTSSFSDGPYEGEANSTVITKLCDELNKQLLALTDEEYLQTNTFEPNLLSIKDIPEIQSEIFMSTGMMGRNVILLHDIEKDEYKLIELDNEHKHEIINYAYYNSEAKLLQFYMSGTTYAPDYYSQDFAHSVFYSIEKEKFEDNEKYINNNIDDLYGYIDKNVYNRQLLINSATIEDNIVKLQFVDAKEKDMLTEFSVEIEYQYNYEEDVFNTILHFKNAQIGELKNIVKDMKEINGVLDVKLEYIENEFLKGTQLVIQTKNSETIKGFDFTSSSTELTSLENCFEIAFN